MSYECIWHGLCITREYHLCCLAVRSRGASDVVTPAQQIDRTLLPVRAGFCIDSCSSRCLVLHGLPARVFSSSLPLPCACSCYPVFQSLFLGFQLFPLFSSVSHGLLTRPLMCRLVSGGIVNVPLWKCPGKRLSLTEVCFVLIIGSFRPYYRVGGEKTKSRPGSVVVAACLDPTALSGRCRSLCGRVVNNRDGSR